MDPKEELARALARALHRSRLVVFDEELDLVFAWNGSATVNIYGLDGSPLDVFASSEAMDVDQARQAIDDHRAAYGSEVTA